MSAFVIGDRVERDLAVPMLTDATPIPDHGDGCSPWLWDPIDDTKWVAIYFDDAPGYTHAQIAGDKIRSAGLLGPIEADRRIAARLRPWSERGQA